MKLRARAFAIGATLVALSGLISACATAAPSSQVSSPAPEATFVAVAPSAEPSPAAPATAAPPTQAPAPEPTVAATIAAGPSPTIESTPYPYTTPLPALEPTILDGFYTKIEPKQGTPVPCARCPDYKPEGGEWTLRFDKGIFRVYHGVRWRSVGSFTINGDHLLLFNDPACHLEVGEYTWRMEGDQLLLSVVEDHCSIDLRAKNLTALPWTKSPS